MTDERAPDGSARWTDTWREGLRAVALRDPRWGGRPAGVGMIGGLVLAQAAANTALQRWAIDGPAQFIWWSFGTGWLSTLLAVAIAGWATRGRPHGPGPGTVFAWTQVPTVVLHLPALAVHVAQTRVGEVPPVVAWGVWIVGMVWPVLATVVLFARVAPRGAARAGIAALTFAFVAAEHWLPAGRPWRADVDEAAMPDEPPGPRLTQAALESQSRAVVAALDAVQPQRPGVTDLYAITFAPVADENVFSREVAMVGDVLRTRLDAGGRLINLQNHADTLADVPWATPLNLERAIHRMAERMDPEEDILFLHLTSHGARDGQLSAEFYPLDVDPVTPAALRRWLDDAGIRYAVLSISACFSGSWIPALEGPGTLVMTAADATHTSYGCGRLSELTFFGRAVYDEQLRDKTRSFEAAFAAAKPVILQREVEAGKKDGPSNPQIRVGEAIRPRLGALLERVGP